MNTEDFMNDIPLSVAVAAHNGTSFVPERRGAAALSGYAEALVADYTQLSRDIKTDEMKALLDAEFARYREGYRRRYTDFLQSRSRIISPMIAGPSNFPVRQMEKRNRASDNKLNELIDFRKRALDSITRKLHPEWRPIMSGDANAAERMETKIAEAEALQERMKAVNAAHKRYLKNPASLDGSDLPDDAKAKIREYTPAYSWEPHPYAPCQMQNNNANIRRMKERLEQIERNQSKPAAELVGEDGIRFEDCPAENRIRIYFPDKPSVEVRADLKRHGFRWAPSLGVWQAYRNSNSVGFAQSMVTAATAKSQQPEPLIDQSVDDVCPDGPNCQDAICRQEREARRLLVELIA